jgi:hypothetical protein
MRTVERGAGQRFDRPQDCVRLERGLLGGDATNQLPDIMCIISDETQGFIGGRNSHLVVMKSFRPVTQPTPT